MEIMYVKKASTNYFSSKNFIGFYGEIKDLTVLLDEIKIITIKKNSKVSRYIPKNKMYNQILNITTDLLKKKTNDISYGEYKLALLLYTISLEPEVIILNNFDLGFNSKIKSKISKLIKTVNAEHKTNFIIISNDINFINKTTKHIIISKNKVIKYQGDILTAIKQGFIDKPPIITFIDMANEKGANLEYTLDNKELLKGIYRSVF